MLAAGAISNIPELGCIALLLVCAGWQDELRWFDNMVRIGSYIRIILEPQIPGLNWETALHKLNSAQGKIGFFRRLIPTLFTTYGVFVITCLSFSLILYLETPPVSIARTVLFFGLLIVGLFFAFKTITSAMNFRDRGHIWDEIFTDISKQLLN